jgi:hypothetical protein
MAGADATSRMLKNSLSPGVTSRITLESRMRCRDRSASCEVTEAQCPAIPVCGDGRIPLSMSRYLTVTPHPLQEEHRGDAGETE